MSLLPRLGHHRWGDFHSIHIRTVSPRGHACGMPGMCGSPKYTRSQPLTTGVGPGLEAGLVLQ